MTNTIYTGLSKTDRCMIWLKLGKYTLLSEHHVGIPLSKLHHKSSHEKIRNKMFTLVVDSCGINYTGKYNLLHNELVNKYQRKHQKFKQKRGKIKVPTCILVLVLIA